jgi:LysR family cys regulon transcriptional activator
MEIIQLLSFYHIVKTGSLKKASTHVFRTESALSHQIKNLEKELGVELLRRLGRGIMLTQEGEILFNTIRTFLSDLEGLKKIYIDISGGKVGSLTISSSSSVMRYVLPNVIKKFIKRFPRIKFKFISCGLTSEIAPLVAEGEADFGIGLRLNRLLSGNISFLLWKSFDIVLVSAKNHPLTKKRRIGLSDISRYPLILFRKGTTLRDHIEHVFITNNLPCNIRIEADVAEYIKTYVEMGIGLSILSCLTLTPSDRKRLAVFNITNLFGKADYGIYYKKDQHISTAMKHFIEVFSPELLGRINCQLSRTLLLGRTKPTH